MSLLQCTSFCDVEKRRPLRRRPNDLNFGSLLLLAVTAGAFLLVTLATTTRRITAGAVPLNAFCCAPDASADEQT